MWVVCDRFADSTLAYQCFGQGVPRSVWEALAEVALGSLRPDLTVLLDLPPEAGLARAAARGETNRYEALDPGFHARVRAGFRAIAAAEPGRCVVADATDAPEGVAAAILAAVESRLSPF
jgi:dTMP kinase